MCVVTWFPSHDQLVLHCIQRQGETQVSSKPEAAFAVAAVAVALAAAYPHVKELMLCHFHSMCPILVPFYIPEPSDISDEDHKRWFVTVYHSCNHSHTHNRMLGYKVVGGTLEAEENYYKRISGIVRLYAAVIQYPVPKDIVSYHNCIITLAHVMCL